MGKSEGKGHTNQMPVLILFEIRNVSSCLFSFFVTGHLATGDAIS